MTISIDLDGCYWEHKMYFDLMAEAMQKAGHRVGVITGRRDKERPAIIEQVGFKMDFLHVWGDDEAIVNGSAWKVKMMIHESVSVHFDDDATEIKKLTDKWIIKVMSNADKKKF